MQDKAQSEGEQHGSETLLHPSTVWLSDAVEFYRVVHSEP